LACGSQPAHEKLLNRRIRAGALTTAPSFDCRYPRDHRADPMPFDYGLAIGHKNFWELSPGFGCETVAARP
jgi:hypothetical protein